MRPFSLLAGVLVSGLLLASCSHVTSTFGWADSDFRYDRNAQIDSISTSADSSFSHVAWRGERVSALALFRASEDVCGLAVTNTGLLNGTGRIEVKASPVGYVTGDVLATKFSQCSARNTIDWEPIEAADLIGVELPDTLKAGEVLPLWLTVEVPSNAAPGTWSGKLTIIGRGMRAQSLPYSLEVCDKTLPAPSEWPFHLDLWQNPYAVARFYNVPLWSPEHFDAMTPVMKLLARAGQKVVTTTIMNRPWNGQTEDPFGSMVVKTRAADGSWSYDYAAFDKWVEYMASIGIDDQINCYTLIPWNLTFDYVDAATGSECEVQAEPGSPEYAAYWGPFIADFAAHLRSKGWFEKTYIAMDERSEEAMSAALTLIRSVEPEFKVALAGSYHESVADRIDDLCIGFCASYPEGAVERRRSEGKVTTYYTCCAEKYPNTFMASSPAEAAWIPLVAMQKGVDGYLRWAFNSWTADPEHDARFRTWAAGDCYMVYPGGRSSVRFEKLLEGLQLYEKARLALPEDVRTEAASMFTFDEITSNGPVPALRNFRSVVDGYSR